MPNKRLGIKVQEFDADHSLQVVIFDGDFDKVGHSDVKEELDNFIKEFKGSRLVFDFSALKFINSEGIGYLMEIHAFLKKRDAQLILIGPNAHVKDVFETIGISDIVPIYSDLKEFLSKLV